MKIVEEDKCCGCEACRQVCPLQCITMKLDEEGFLFPIINESTCIQCQKCVMACPVNILKEV